MSQKNAKLTSREDFPQFERNPSVARAMKSISKKQVSSRSRGESTMIVGSDTGQVLGEGSVLFLESKVVDQQPFSKIFAGELGRLLGLNKAARRVLDMVHQIISTRPNVDFVPLHPRIVETFGEDMSRRTFDRGINELLAENLLYRSRIPHQYYVDVTVMFNGDRIVLAREYVKKESQSRLATGCDRTLELDFDA